MRRLLLLRHAKAEQAKKDTSQDRDRVLTERGRSDAPRIGLLMRARGYLPDLILCSPSARTRETLELTGIGKDIRSEFPEVLYLASVSQITALIRELPDEAHLPLVVGHNPGLEECATALIGKWEDMKLRSKFCSGREKFPACALAALEFPVAKWGSLERHSGTLVDFATPKELASR